MTPSQHGTTMVIDTGLPTGAFTDLIESHGHLIDLIKFGWGTALVTRDLDRKAAVLKEAGVGFYFGGTLFEHYVWTGRLQDYLSMVEQYGATHIEVSNGTIPLDQSGKADYVRRLAGIRPVLSEVGYKDADRSALLTPADWVDALAEDLSAWAMPLRPLSRASVMTMLAPARAAAVASPRPTGPCAAMCWARCWPRSTRRWSCSRRRPRICRSS